MRPRRIATVGSMGPFRRFMGEALIFALARSVLSSRQPAVPPPALIAHLILWRAGEDETGHRYVIAGHL